MGRQFGLGFDLRGNCCYDGCGAELVSYVILDNNNRAIAVLLGTNPGAEVGIIHLAS